MKKVVLFVVGFLMIIAGVALVLKDWAAVVLVFRGVIGALLAVVGLAVLCIAKE